MSLKISVKNLNLSELGKGFHREIDSVSSEITIEELINRISKELNITDPTLIDILYRGQILNRSQTFGNYINQNSNEADIYLFKSANQAKKSDKPTAHEIYTLVNGLNSIFRSRTKKNYLEVFLQDNRRVNEILAPLPAIRNDPIAYGFVQNYDLIKYLNDQKRAESILQSNGNIYHAVKLIIEHIREFSKKNPVDEKFISKRSYTIDDASEDEQEQARSNNHHQQQQAARTGPAISQDHFAAVLAMLNQQQQAQRGGPSTSSQSSNVPPLQTQRQPSSATQPAASQPQPQLPSPQLFDRNQFQSLMQQIMGQQPPQPQQQPTTPSTSAQPQQQQQQQQQQPPAISSELAAKLEQMHEFGFFDDATNLRALEITEGNVEAAISLIIEGGDML